VGIGEAIWDVYSKTEKFPGGVPVNCAVHASQLGHQGILISRVGADAAGAEMLAELSRRGVETRFVQQDPTEPTARVAIKIGADGTPDFTCRQKSRAFHYLRSQPEWTQLQPDAIVFTVLGQLNPAAGAAIQNYLNSATTAFKLLDANAYFLSKRIFEILPESLKLADGLKLNTAEFETLATVLRQTGTDEPVTIPALMRQFDLELVLLTRGGRGAEIFIRNQNFEIDAFNSAPQDTNGCGDAFATAALILFLLNRPIEEIARVASELAALVAGARGAVPEYRIQDHEFKTVFVH
jgi:fructokinase